MRSFERIPHNKGGNDKLCVASLDFLINQLCVTIISSGVRSHPHGAAERLHVVICGIAATVSNIIKTALIIGDNDAGTN